MNHFAFTGSILWFNFEINILDTKDILMMFTLVILILSYRNNLATNIWDLITQFNEYIVVDNNMS